MKRILLRIVLAFFCAGYVYADYVNPPGWETNPYFTHQTWEFNTDANPAIPDGGYNNPYGPPEPTATITNSTWLSDYGTDPMSYGLWDFQGPSTDALIDIYIPNEPNENLYKEVWVQLTFYATYPGGNIMSRGYGGVFFPDKTTPATLLSATCESLGMVDDLYLKRSTTLWKLDPQPEAEYIILGCSMDDNERFLLDQVSIDTRCVPEPATLSLMALGGILLLKKRKS